MIYLFSTRQWIKASCIVVAVITVVKIGEVVDEPVENYLHERGIGIFWIFKLSFCLFFTLGCIN